VPHEGGGEALGAPAFLEAQDDEFERAMHALENGLAVFKAEEAGDAAGVEEHVAELHGAEVGVDARGDDDAGAAIRAQEVDSLLEEILVEVEVGADLAPVDGADLVGELGASRNQRLRWGKLER
jgi:hypothetical protein